MQSTVYASVCQDPYQDTNQSIIVLTCSGLVLSWPHEKDRWPETEAWGFDRTAPPGCSEGPSRRKSRGGHSGHGILPGLHLQLAGDVSGGRLG